MNMSLEKSGTALISVPKFLMQRHNLFASSLHLYKYWVVEPREEEMV
jgi:hypothetical protein